MVKSLMTDFDAWARLSARLLRRGALECARIIRDAGVEHDWHRADAHWYGQLLQDVETGRTDRIDRYRLLCVESMGARRRSGDTVPSPLDVLRPPGAVARGDETPEFARGFATQAAVKPSPGQLGTAMNMGGEVDVDAARALAARWTVEDYAWLCAELERFPEREDRVWGARGITDAKAQRTVRELWDARLDNDDGLRSHYGELLVAYRGVLQQR